MATILTPQGALTSSPMSIRERELVNNLRIMLKDVPDDVYRSLSTLVEEKRGERWTDLQLLIYLQQAIADINSEPALTSYTLDDFPESWRATVINGGIIWALFGEAVSQVGLLFLFFNCFLFFYY